MAARECVILANLSAVPKHLGKVTYDPLLGGWVVLKKDYVKKATSKVKASLSKKASPKKKVKTTPAKATPVKKVIPKKRLSQRRKRLRQQRRYRRRKRPLLRKQKLFLPVNPFKSIIVSIQSQKNRLM